MDWDSFFLSFILTVIAYLAFPIIRLLINRGKFEKRSAKKIALWNSIIVGAMFCIITIASSGAETTWNAAPAVVYYFINCAILTDKKVQNMQPEGNDTDEELSEQCAAYSSEFSSQDEFIKVQNSDNANENVILFPNEAQTIKVEYRAITTTNILDNIKACVRNKRKVIAIVIASIVAIALIILSIVLLVEKCGDRNEIESVGVRTITFDKKYKAERVLESWENGEATEDSMIELMDEYGYEQGGGKLYIITRGEFVEEIDEWCFSPDREIGDYAIIKNVYGYSLCYISSFNEDPEQDERNDGMQNYKKIGVTFEQYRIATIITDKPQSYCKYIADLKSTLAKGTYGDDVKIEKATEYIDNLPLDYGQKIILFRIQFPKDTTYNSDIVDYLNEREDITRDEMVYILEELGFALFDDGTVKW